MIKDLNDLFEKLKDNQEKNLNIITKRLDNIETQIKVSNKNINSIQDNNIEMINEIGRIGKDIKVIKNDIFNTRLENVNNIDRITSQIKLNTESLNKI